MGVKEKDGMDRLLFIVDKRRREERYALSQCFGIFAAQMKHGILKQNRGNQRRVLFTPLFEKTSE